MKIAFVTDSGTGTVSYTHLDVYKRQQLFCLGIMGEYLARTYMETKRRPIYVQRNKIDYKERTKQYRQICLHCFFCAVYTCLLYTSNIDLKSIPFPVCQTAESLTKELCIKDYDKKSIKAFKDMYFMYQDGESTKRVSSFIYQQLKQS